MATLQQLLIRREGKELKVYKDSRGKPTVGIGHLVVPADKLKLGDEVDEARVQAFFDKDTKAAVSAAKRQAATAKISDANFAVYLASVNFQLGSRWNLTFKKAWAMIMAGKYSDAAKEVQKSRWYNQTPVRVKDFQKALLALPDKKGAAAGAAPAK